MNEFTKNWRDKTEKFITEHPGVFAISASKSDIELMVDALHHSLKMISPGSKEHERISQLINELRGLLE